MVELLAPAGSAEALRAAFTAGADAVYIGGNRFGARAYADNPDDEELLRLLDLTHRLGKKLYLTVNTLVRDDELEELAVWMRPFYEHGLDAAIVQDPGIIRIFSRIFPDLPLHASTQMTVTGVEGSRFLLESGLKRIVPARELSLEELKRIRRETGAELETFIHGALCYGYSGVCLMSSMIGGRSGNRGRCAGICRTPFQVQKDNVRLSKPGENYPLNMKDLCTVDMLPDLIDAGISSFKIEGRMKKPEYTAGVTAVYRKAIDACMEKDPAYITEAGRSLLAALYNRDGFTDGYYRRHNGRGMLAVKNEKLQNTRSREAQITTERIRKDLQEKLAEGCLQVPVTGSLHLKAGEPAALKVCTDVPEERDMARAEAAVTGLPAEKASTQPVSEERIRKQMNKTGAAFFRFSTLFIDTEEDLFIPMQALNNLRREAFAALEERILQPYRRTAGPSSLPEIGETAAADTVPLEPLQRKLPLYACPHSAEQLAVILRSPQIRGVYLSRELAGYAGEVKKSGKLCFLALPYILREKPQEAFRSLPVPPDDPLWDGILLRNLEEAGWYCHTAGSGKSTLPPAILDIHLYTMNSQAAAFFAEHGLRQRTLPCELNFRQLRAQDTRGSEILLYGRLPVMFSAQCPKKTCGKCDGKPEWVSLTDRKNMTFPVWCGCRPCGTVVYNSLPTGLLQESRAVAHLGCRSGRLVFTDETPDLTEQIIQAYGSVFAEGKEPSGEASLPPATKGHFRRGVL